MLHGEGYTQINNSSPLHSSEGGGGGIDHSGSPDEKHFKHNFMVWGSASQKKGQST